MISVSIGLIGDRDAKRPSHWATEEALRHCAARLGVYLEAVWLPTDALEVDRQLDKLREFDGFWCAPGSPYKSMAGALNGIRFARENGIPFIGTCGGFQHAVIEYARNVLGVRNAGHEEYGGGAQDLFVTALACSLVGESRRVFIKENTSARRIYGCAEAEERFNCNYGLNSAYAKRFEENGFMISGTDENGEARILELPSNRFHVVTLFQPQLSSTPENPHKLIVAYLNACAPKE
jgi:CTP synthase (UTP-ammonia lyase)